MNTQELYINGKPIALDQSSVLALNFAANTLYDMSSVQGNISNKFTVPPTQENRAALGFVDDINVDLSKTARKRSICKYVQNGIEIIPGGTVDIGTITSKGIEVTITSGNINFFDLIDKENISDLNLINYDHPFTADAIVSSFSNTSAIGGYTYPVIDYGAFDNTGDVDLTLMRPSVFFKTIVDSIVAESGFTLVNQLETNKKTKYRYNNLIVPFSNTEFIHAPRAVVDLSKSYLKAFNYDNTTYSGAGSKTIQFNQNDDPSGSFLDGIYKTKLPTKADVQLNIAEALVNVTSLAGGTEGIEIRIYKNRDILGVFKQNLITPLGQGNGYPKTSSYKNINITATGIALIPGDTINATIEILHNNRSVRLLTPISLIITPTTRKEIVYGDTVELESNLPDISKKDFLKAVAAIFCAIIQCDNVTKTVYIVPFFSIAENALKAKDWTEKVINPETQSKEINIGDYGQTNTAEYKNDDVIVPENYGWGTLAIADENLKTANTLFSLPFSASIDVTKLIGVQMVQILKIDNTKMPFEFSISTGARILMRRYLSGTTLNFKSVAANYNVSINENIPVGYFATDLLLQNVLNDYYDTLNSVLNDQRKLVIDMKLTEVDISELDFFLPVYLGQYSALFYISQIKNYLTNTTCSAELVKLY